MRIVHLCFAAPYNDGWTYQENLLPLYHRRAGHDVTVLAMPFEMESQTGSFGAYHPERYTDANGIHVIRERLRFDWLRSTRSRFGMYRDIEVDLLEVEPEVVFVHGLQFMDLHAVARYCRSHPATRLYIDNHADYYNSARNPLSQWLLHGVIWRWGMRRVDGHVTRYWGITEESCEFLVDTYGVSREKIGLLPLGATTDVLDSEDRLTIRARVRQHLGLAETDFLMVTGGKIDFRKRIHEVMAVVRDLGRDDVKLLVFGSVLPDLRDTFEGLLKDPRIKYVGWADSVEIAEYLVAGDLAVFPGTQSVLWAQAVAGGTPCVFRRWQKGSPVDIGGNCRFLETDDYSELLSAVKTIVEAPSIHRDMQLAAASPERLRFSYARIAERAIGE